MRALLLALVLLLGATPAFAQKKKKDKAAEAAARIAAEKAEKEALQQQMTQEAPALVDWFQTFYEPKAKFVAVDASKPPQLKMRLSVMGWSREARNVAPVPELEKAILSAEVYLAKGDEKRPKAFVEFGAGGKPPEGGPPAQIVPMDKAGIPLDVVVIASGHAGYKRIPGLEEGHRKAVLDVIGGLGDARMNVIWHGAMLYTYRSFEGLEGELSRYDESLSSCEGARRRYRIDAVQTLKEGEKAPALPPCGLQEGKAGDLSAALEIIPYRGKYSRLFDIYRTSDACVELESASTAIRSLDLDEVVQRTDDRGAFEEALRLLVRDGRPEARKAIIVLGDGRDGFIDEDASCRDRFTERDCAGAAKDKSGAEAVEAVRRCVQSKLDARATAFQERFAGKVPTWLGLARAFDIQVHAIAYNMTEEGGRLTSHTYERERLELLALQTGGTYREVVNKPSDIGNAAALLVSELNSEKVVLLGADLEPGTKGTVKMAITLGEPFEGMVIETQEWAFKTPTFATGWRPKVERWNRMLKMKVGPIWYWVIIVLGSLLALYMAWLFLKMLKALVMKIVGLFTKGAKDAAKKAQGAAKGVGDAAKKAGAGASKGVLDAAKKAAPKVPKK